MSERCCEFGSYGGGPCPWCQLKETSELRATIARLERELAEARAAIREAHSRSERVIDQRDAALAALRDRDEMCDPDLPPHIRVTREINLALARYVRESIEREADAGKRAENLFGLIDWLRETAIQMECAANLGERR